MSKSMQLVGWVLTVTAPALLLVVWRAVPEPGSLLAAGAIIGAYCGYLLYEHIVFRGVLSQRTVYEQLAFAFLLLCLFSISL